jgi:hypothetical protein
MSTATAGTPSNSPQRTSHQPGALAILTATAMGGVIASRLGKAPLVFAAGAAALALLRQKKVAPAPQIQRDQPLPAPQVDIPPQSQVEQWLSEQISREKLAPVIEFSTLSASPSETEDDYHPESFLLEDAEEPPTFSHADDSFAQLTDPVAWHLPVSAPPIAEGVDLPVQSAQWAPQTITAPPPIDAAWTLGVEPLPSLSEAAPFSALPSSMFSAAPVQQKDLDPQPQPAVPAPVFEGAAFPDEIDVVPAIEPVVHLTPSPPEVQAPAWLPPEPETVQEHDLPPLVESTAETPREIVVHIAAPGEASFDPPLAAAPENPWEPESEAPPTPYVAPFHFHPTNPLVEAEIILRPRAPMQNTVTTKTKPSSQSTITKDFAESFDTPPAEAAAAPLPPGPLPLPQEPRARSTWRSWWRGD